MTDCLPLIPVLTESVNQIENNTCSGDFVIQTVDTLSFLLHHTDLSTSIIDSALRKPVCNKDTC